MTQNYTIVWSSDIKNNYNKIYKNKDDEIKMNLLLKNIDSGLCVFFRINLESHGMFRNGSIELLL